MTDANNLPDAVNYMDAVDKKYKASFVKDSILVCDGLGSADVLSRAISTSTHHVVQLAHGDFSREINVAALMMHSGDAFAANPISGILDPVSVGPAADKKLELLNFDFSRAAQKHEMLYLIEDRLTQKNMASSFRSTLMLAADELITNAVFNAPFVDFDNTLPGASRGDPETQMPEGKSGQLFLGYAADKIMLAVKDPFGSLNTNKILGRIKSCFDQTLAKAMNMTGPGGAGIGSFMIYNSGTSFYIAVDRGVYSVVGIAAPLKMSSRARQQLPKNLHVFNKKKEQLHGAI